MTSKSPSRRAERKERLRGEILAAAGKMFADRGYEAVTLRAIAEEIGYTHAVIYQHFPDKAHILAELSRETIGLMIQNFDAIAAKHPRSKDRLFATSRGLIQFCTAHPQQFRNVFFGPPRTATAFARVNTLTTLGRRCSRVSWSCFSMCQGWGGLPSRNDIGGSPTPGGSRSLASPHSLLYRGLCPTCLTRLSWSSKRSQRFGPASRLFRDCQRAQSLSGPADPVLQSNKGGSRTLHCRTRLNSVDSP